MADTQRATPPADFEAEQALVGAYILDPAVGDRVKIKASDFYRPAHETIWSVLTTLNGEHPDRARGVLDGLRERGELRGHLTGSYIHDCISACQTPAAAEQYARTVHQLARKRRALETLRRGIQKVESIELGDIDGPIFEVMADVEDIARDAATRLDLTTWEPLNLDVVLEGGELDPPPSLLPRSDGKCLLYPASVHVFAGEPGAGKTFLALYATLLEFEQGHRVTFIDFEDRASRVVGRLLAMGARPEQIRDLFTYQRPARPLDDTSRAQMEHAIGGRSLVVVDGVTEAMTMHGYNLKDNGDIASFYALMPRWIADHGPATVLIDHVVKDAETQGRWALGGGHKIAGTDGVAYTIRAIEPFGRGKKGVARISISRDRPGWIEDIAIGKTAAVFRLDSITPEVSIPELDAPVAIPTTESGELRPTRQMHAIWLYLTMNPGATKNQIEEGVRGHSNSIKRAALARLIEEHFVVAEEVRGRIRHTVQDTFDPDQEPLK